MFWQRYVGVCGALLLAGTLIGGLLFFVFTLLVPADAGEGGPVLTFAVTVWGALIGAGVALVASVSFAIAISLWVRRADRSVQSTAWMGAGGAALGAALVWFGVWISWGLSTPYAWGNLWIAVILAVFSALLAAAVAGPLTSAAAKKDRGHSSSVEIV